VSGRELLHWRGVKRRWFNTFAAISLFITVVLVALCIERIRGTDFIYRADSHSQYTLAVGAGEISLDSIGGFHNKSPATPEWHVDHIRAPINIGQQTLVFMGRPQRFYERLGFYFIGGATSGQWMGRLSLIGVPLWFLLLVFSAPPALWMRNYLQSRRALRVGHCRVCGYDLRASSDRCPECGTSI